MVTNAQSEQVTENWIRAIAEGIKCLKGISRLKLQDIRNSYWLMGKKEMIRLPVVPFDSGRNQRGNTNPNKNKGLHFAAI
jgi:hypothetical protein